MVKAYNQQIASDPNAHPITPIALGYRTTEGDMATDDTWTLALLFFENILVARMGGPGYCKLFIEPKPDDPSRIVMANALDDFRKLVSYSNLDASALTWNAALDMVLNGEAAMTIMGDWGKGYANAKHKVADDVRRDADAGHGRDLRVHHRHVRAADGRPECPETRSNLLEAVRIARRAGHLQSDQGSISARGDSDIDDTTGTTRWRSRRSTTSARRRMCPARRSWRRRVYLDAISGALAEFAKARENGNPSIVQHTLDNYADVLLASCWPTPAANCHCVVSLSVRLKWLRAQGR